MFADGRIRERTQKELQAKDEKVAKERAGRGKHEEFQRLMDRLRGLAYKDAHAPCNRQKEGQRRRGTSSDHLVPIPGFSANQERLAERKEELPGVSTIVLQAVVPIRIPPDGDLEVPPKSGHIAHMR